MATKDLLGRWIPEAAATPDADQPYTEVEFLPDGKLRYAVKNAGADDALVLEWRADDRSIVTRAPGTTREEKTGYELGSDGSLTLEFGGHRSRYIKVH
jgi:hypothetical protein